MPYCSSCGNQIAATDRFCAACGAAQPGGSSTGTAGSSGAWQSSVFQGTPPRTASTICYIPFVGWIASLLILAAERFRQDKLVRFHAFQGLYLFVVWLLVDLIGDNLGGGSRGLRWVFYPLRFALFGAWIYMLLQTNQDKLVKLPLIGELADRSVEEQK